MATFVTWQDTASTGSEVNFNIIFNFLSRTHVEVLFDSAIQATTSWSFTSDAVLKLNTAAASGVIVRVRRTTPLTVLTDFQGGRYSS